MSVATIQLRCHVLCGQEVDNDRGLNSKVHILRHASKDLHHSDGAQLTYDYPNYIAGCVKQRATTVAGLHRC